MHARGSLGFLASRTFTRCCGRARAATQTCAKKSTDGALIHTSEWATGLLPHTRLRTADDQIDCFICTDIVNPAKYPKRSVPGSPCSVFVGLVRSFAYR